MILRKIFLLFMATLLCPFLSWGADDLGVRAKPIPLTVEWYRPELSLTTKPRRSRVIISGQTLPGSKLFVDTDKIPLISRKSDKIRYILTKNVLTAPMPREASSDGQVEIVLDLPWLICQLPFRVESPDGQIKRYQFTVDVWGEEAVRLTSQNLKANPYRTRKFSVWGGSGINLLRYSQKSNDIPASLDLQTLKGPSYFLKGQWNISSEWTAQGSFSISPGEASSSGSVQVDQGEYNWSIFTADGIWKPRNWRPLLRNKYRSELGLIFGVQNHIVPFMSRTGGSVGATEIDTNNLTMIAVGGALNVNFSRRWAFESFLRYQYPIATGSLFAIEPELAFDGSVGVIFKWKPNWHIGGFWYGQWHRYQFSDHEDKYFQVTSPTENPISGEQSLFFSNIEFRIGYEFDGPQIKSK